MQNDMDDWRDLHIELIDSVEHTEFSLVELVLTASELSEDENEIFDLVDGIICRAGVELTPLHRDGSLDA
jgi:hypothetical protein